MADMVYKFRDGARVHGDAQAVGNKLADIRAAKGALHPIDVLDDARPKASVLHRYFEWDNKEAAEQWRLSQARHLIASVVVVETPEHGEIAPIRAWCKLGDASGYEAIHVVLSSPEKRLLALREVRSSIGSLRDKLASFEGFANVLTGLEQVEMAVTQHIEQVEAGVHG